MKSGAITKYEIITLAIALVALAVSGLSLYFQYYKQDKLIIRLNPIGYNQKDGLVFDLAVLNLGNTSGMLSLNSLKVLNENSTTKGFVLPINKKIIVKPGEIETVSFVTKDDKYSADPFTQISDNNKKHDLLLNLKYLNADAKAYGNNLNMGFICMSSSKKTIHTDTGYLTTNKLLPERGGHTLQVEGDMVTYGDTKSGFTKIK